jgi:RHH-type transcriptional regulator, proline utilization regulon repressor / proline dehydrogenase / delta 1-pyrroline-5-carboxylate dehydrogenase
LRAPGADYEFQRLHGMGGCCMRKRAANRADFPRVRVYAPVGEHKDLLAYLVRRLLENGANTSFVNRFMDEQVPVNEIVRDPIDGLERWKPTPIRGLPCRSRCIPIGAIPAAPTSAIPPSSMCCADGIAARRQAAGRGPIIDGVALAGERAPVTNPPIGATSSATARDASAAEIAAAFDAAARAQPEWNAIGAAARADCLERPPTCSRSADFHALLVREAGKTLPDALAEVREAADFCRYYALQARASIRRADAPHGADRRTQRIVAARTRRVRLHQSVEFSARDLCRPGDRGIGRRQLGGRQAGGTDAADRRAFRRTAARGRRAAAGLQFTPAPGRLFGEVAFAHPALAGVAMTGSTATALTINRQLAARGGPIVPLIAETGGLNAMIVDSTALPEQVVDDVMSSAFLSAGQRCSALRLLFLQEDVADVILEMIAGAMDELIIGDPARCRPTWGR